MYIYIYPTILPGELFIIIPYAMNRVWVYGCYFIVELIFTCFQTFICSSTDLEDCTADSWGSTYYIYHCILRLQT